MQQQQQTAMVVPQDALDAQRMNSTTATNTETVLATLKTDVNNLHVSVGLHLKSAKEDAATAGEKLIEAKEVLPHGEFKPWVEANCKFSYRQARKYMQVAKAKVASRGQFEACASMAEVLNIGKEYEKDPASASGAFKGTAKDETAQRIKQKYDELQEVIDQTFEGWKNYGEAMLEVQEKLGDGKEYRAWQRKNLDHELTPAEEAGALLSAREPTRFNGLRTAFPHMDMHELGEIILKSDM